MRFPFYDAPVGIDSMLWIRLLDDPDITYPENLAMLQVFYKSPGFENAASVVAPLVGLTHQVALTGQVVRWSKRIVKATNIQLPRDYQGSINWWHIPFWGYYGKKLFMWILRPELVAACSVRFGAEQKSAVLVQGEVEPEELPPLYEGAHIQVAVNRYERNPTARARCIAHYGCACLVCGFDFAAFYGPLGAGKIHVHHIVPLSRIKTRYVVNPIADLRPVCPNCHVMIHSRQEPFSLEELQALIRRSTVG